jgi:hypothetical protein
MENFNEIKKKIIEQLDNAKYDGDLSDIGNEIGIVVAEYFDEENTVDDFMHGLKHGISLTDGTH